MRWWSQIYFQNAKREVPQLLNKLTEVCIEAQYYLTDFIISPKEQGYTIQPNNPGTCDGIKNYIFNIKAESDSEY